MPHTANAKQVTIVRQINFPPNTEKTKTMFKMNHCYSKLIPCRITYNTIGKFKLMEVYLPEKEKLLVDLPMVVEAWRSRGDANVANSIIELYLLNY